VTTQLPETPGASARAEFALKRALSLGHATLYGLGVTIGAGIYVLIGAAAARAGMYAPVAFVIAAVALLLVSSGRALASVVGWLLGSLGGAGYPELAVAAPLVFGGSALLLFRWRTLNLLLLGDEAAAGLGVDLVPARRGLVLLATLVTSASVALAGTIGFVGLVVPHLVRLAIGPDHRLLLPVSCLGGAALLVLADMVARLVGGVPVGVVTALIGAPFFLWLLHRAAGATTTP